MCANLTYLTACNTKTLYFKQINKFMSRAQTQMSSQRQITQIQLTVFVFICLNGFKKQENCLRFIKGKLKDFVKRKLPQIKID